MFYSGMVNGVKPVLDTQVNLYPNPSSGFFQFALPNNAEITELSCFNAAGKQIEIRKQGNTFQIPEGTQAGIYIIRYTDNSGNTGSVKLSLE